MFVCIQCYSWGCRVNKEASGLSSSCACSVLLSSRTWRDWLASPCIYFSIGVPPGFLWGCILSFNSARSLNPVQYPAEATWSLASVCFSLQQTEANWSKASRFAALGLIDGCPERPLQTVVARVLVFCVVSRDPGIVTIHSSPKPFYKPLQLLNTSFSGEGYYSQGDWVNSEFCWAKQPGLGLW